MSQIRIDNLDQKAPIVTPEKLDAGKAVLTVISDSTSFDVTFYGAANKHAKDGVIYVHRAIENYMTNSVQRGGYFDDYWTEFIPLHAAKQVNIKYEKYLVDRDV